MYLTVSVSEKISRDRTFAILLWILTCDWNSSKHFLQDESGGPWYQKGNRFQVLEMERLLAGGELIPTPRFIHGDRWFSNSVCTFANCASSKWASSNHCDVDFLRLGHLSPLRTRAEDVLFPSPGRGVHPWGRSWPPHGLWALPIMGLIFICQFNVMENRQGIGQV